MHSAAQSRKLERNPCTVARSARPTVRRIFVSVMSESGRPPTGEWNTSPDSPRRGAASSSAAIAASLSGTRCSTPPFIRSAGIVHRQASRSISSHVAPLASPDLAAVSTRNSKHAFAATPALDAAMISSAAGTSRYGRARKLSPNRGHGGQRPVNALSGRVLVAVTVGDCPKHHGADLLPDAVGGLLACSPYWREHGGHVSPRDPVHWHIA